MYDEGNGIKQDKQKAFYWYTKAAEQGYLYAQYNLANMYYEKGNGTKQDKQKAFYWYTKAAEQGYAEAQYNLAIMYYQGDRKSVV